MKNLSAPRAQRRTTRRARQSAATLLFAMGLVVSALASPSVAAEVSVDDATPTLEQCRQDFERTGKVSEECAPHRVRLLEEKAAAEKAAAEKAAAEKAAAEKAAAEKAAAEKAAAEKAAADKAAAEKAAAEKAALDKAVADRLAARQAAAAAADPVVPVLDEDCDEGFELVEGVCVALPDPTDPTDPVDPGEPGEPGDGDCEPPLVDDGNGDCVPPVDPTDPVDPPDTGIPCTGTDYNGDEDGCGLPPVDGGDGGNGNNGGNGNGNGNQDQDDLGTIDGDQGDQGEGQAAGEQIGSVAGQPEGVGSTVTQCGGSVVCQSTPVVPEAAAAPTTQGLPETGAPDDAGLLWFGAALLAGGAVLLRPRRGAGRHRLTA